MKRSICVPSSHIFSQPPSDPKRQEEKGRKMKEQDGKRCDGQKHDMKQQPDPELQMVSLLPQLAQAKAYFPGYPEESFVVQKLRIGAPVGSQILQFFFAVRLFKSLLFGFLNLSLSLYIYITI